MIPAECDEFRDPQPDGFHSHRRRLFAERL